jgi:hypothetical protein
MSLSSRIREREGPDNSRNESQSAGEFENRSRNGFVDCGLEDPDALLDFLKRLDQKATLNIRLYIPRERIRRSASGSDGFAMTSRLSKTTVQ